MIMHVFIISDDIVTFDLEESFNWWRSVLNALVIMKILMCA